MKKDGNGHGRALNLGHIQTLLYRVEDGILVVLLCLMIGVAALQILLRNFFGAGIVWGDMLVRVLVLWVGLVGAMAAARQNKHISIDLVARYLPAGLNLPAKTFVELFTTVICSLASYYSFVFVRSEFYEGGSAFAQVPVWMCALIIPVAFAVMALRYLVMALAKLNTILTRNTGE